MLCAVSVITRSFRSLQKYCQQHCPDAQGPSPGVEPLISIYEGSLSVMDTYIYSCRVGIGIAAKQLFCTNAVLGKVGCLCLKGPILSLLWLAPSAVGKGTGALRRFTTTSVRDT